MVCHATLGGSSRVASRLASELARAGDEVHLLSPARPTAPLDPAVRLRVVEAPRHPVLTAPPEAMAMAGALVELARAGGLDIIHAHFAVPWATSVTLALDALGRPGPAAVVTLHGSDVVGLGTHPLLREPLRAALSRVHAVTTVSHALRAAAERELQTDRAIDLIENFAPLGPVARPDPAAPVIAHVSNFRPVKRSIDVVETFARVRASVPAKLRLIGDGPERDAALGRAQQLGVADAVEAIGAVGDAQVWLEDVALLLVPSERESFGLAALEAQACAIPVIGTDVDGLPEAVLDGVTGLLHPVGDVAAMAASIVALLEDPARHRAMSEAARERVARDFSPASVLERYRAVYERARRVAGSAG